ncbi:MAG: N-acetylmuramoyl-L-alanine amidase [Bacteroidetes bacterium]|nr:N-acetylmuramoyl-L-alanine amidase [Bacteroidota bacterium]
MTTFVLLNLPFFVSPFNTSLSFFNSDHKSTKDRIIPDNGFQIKAVVIDAGHGGKDSGCNGASSQEKHIALKIAKEFGNALKISHPNIKVIYTRKDDTFIPLYERAAIANQNDADLFISIHCNSMPGLKSVRGSETYVMGLHTAKHNLEVAKRENESILLEENYQAHYDYDPNTPEGHIVLSMYQNAFLEQSILFAQKVESKFASAAKRKSRGVKQAGFVVLKETTMPSVLIEAGFLSNSSEEYFLNTVAGQKRVANAILEAFQEYKAEVEKAPTLSSPLAQTEQTFKTKKIEPTYVNTATTLPDIPHSPKHIVEEVVIKSEPKVIPVTNFQTKGGSTPNSGTTSTLLSSKVIKAGIQFKVQLAATPKPMDISKGKWRSTGYLIEVIKEDNMYKYQARNFNSLKDALDARIKLRNMGFSGAFIVAYQEGNRIKITKAKQQLGLK